METLIEEYAFAIQNDPVERIAEPDWRTHRYFTPEEHMGTETAAKKGGAVLTAEDEFLTYPIHNVVGVFDDRGTARAVVAELISHGFAEKDIVRYHGTEGEDKIDFEGTRHGTLTTLVRALQHIGPDRTYLDRYEKYLHDGDSIVMVRVGTKGRKQSAAEVMHKYAVHRVTYFGLLMIEEV